MNTIPAAGTLGAAIFGLVLAATVSGALIAVGSSRIIRSVCGLAICCLGLGGLYYFLRSPFLAMMEILIYVGAVCITIVFAIMLAEPDDLPRDESFTTIAVWTGLGLLIAAWIFWGLTQFSLRHPWKLDPVRLNDGSVQAIGKSLLTTYSLAFELISLALLVAILGALAIARYGKTRT